MAVSFISGGKQSTPGENHRPAATHWQTLSHDVVASTPHPSGIRTHRECSDYKILTYISINMVFHGHYTSYFDRGLLLTNKLPTFCTQAGLVRLKCSLLKF